MILYQSDNYTIKGNMHTLEQLHKRAINGEMVKNMVNKSVNKMLIQKTYAVIRGTVKLLILRIDIDTYFIITCLTEDMFIKRDTLRIYV